MIKKLLVWYLKKNGTIKWKNKYIVMMSSRNYDEYLMKVCS